MLVTVSAAANRYSLIACEGKPMSRSLLFILALAVGSGLATSAAAQQRSDDDQTEHATAKAHNLDLRYAQIVERIAELNLRKARETNERVPGTISDTELQRLRENVRLARRDSQQLKTSAGDGSNDERLQEARARATVAEGALRKAREANQHEPGTIPELELQRLKLEFEAARINVARQQAAADVPSALAEMRNEISQLRREVARLRRELSQVARPNRSGSEEVRTGAAARD
jgi:hypothetical protein